MRSRKVLVTAAVAVFALVAGALAFWTTSGSGSAAASVGTMSPASVSASAGSAAGSIKLTFSPQALLNGASNSSITYTVYRSADGTTYAPVPSSSGCYGISYGTPTCTDGGLTGTFRYYVLAHFGSSSTGGWTAQSAVAGPVSAIADSTAPVTTATTSPAPNADGWNNTSPVSVTLSADDNGGSGVKEIRYTTDGSTPTSSSTLYSGPFNVSSTATVKFFATDKAGNPETVKSLAVQIDTVAPSGGALTANASTSSSYNTSGVVSLTKVNFTDANSGLAAGSNAVTRATAPLSGNSCGTLAGTAAVTIDASGNDSATLATGCYQYRLNASDVAGNGATPVTSAIVKVDRSAPSTPTLAFSGLSANAFYDAAASRLYIRPAAGGTFSITASSSDADTGVASYAFSNPGSSFGATKTGNRVDYTFGATTTAPSAGQTVNATNAAGSTSADASYSIAADTSAPSGGAITANGSTGDSFNNTGSISLTKTDFTDAGAGVASGSNAISRASTALSNGVCGTIWSTPTAVTVTNGKDAATLGSGCYRYTLDATDNVGNSAPSAVSALVKVDTTAPTGTLTAPTAGTTGGTVNLTSTAADTGGSGLASVTFQEAPAGSTTYVDVATGTGTSSPYSATWDSTTVANGSYNLRAVITDAAGNSTPTASVAVTVNNTFTVSAPGSARTAGAGFNVSLTALANGATNSGYSGAHVVTFTGPSNAPNNTAPTYPATVTFTKGQGTASVVLYDAETTAITATSGGMTGTSGSVTVNNGSSPGGVVLTSSSLTLSCATSVFQCALSLNRGSTAWTSKVSLTDAWGNPGPTAPNGGTTVNLSSSSPGTGTLTPSSVAIVKGAADSAASFSYTPPSGSGNYSTMITASAGLANDAATTVSGH